MLIRLVFAAACASITVAGCTCGDGASTDAAALIVPAETADEAALAVMTDWAALPVFQSGRYRQQSSEDRNTGEEPAQALWRHGNRDMNNFVCASADAEPPIGTKPFVLDHDRCVEPYVRGYVLARFEGSGRLARIWMTAASIRRGPPDREVLRIYVDDRRSPLIQAPLSKVLDGSAGPIFGAPFGAGSSRYLSWYYPVVFGEKLVVTLDRLDSKDLYFHQTAVVLDDEPRPRRAATERLVARDDVLRLLRSSAPAGGAAVYKGLTLAAGHSTEAFELSGPATIVNARFRLAQEALVRLTEAELRVTWDGAAQPAISVNLAQLFSVHDAVPGQSSLAFGAALGPHRAELSLRLPMPFRSSTTWQLSNRGREALDMEISLETVPSVPAASFGHLHVQTFDTRDTKQAAHPLATATGPGRLVGVCMALRGHGLQQGRRPGHPMNFLEGDEIGMVDGHRAIAGTGTEDYFNGAFYFEDGPTANAFAQVWDIVPSLPEAKNKARVSACRWHVLSDTIDFSRSLALEMEIGPGVPEVLDRYRSVAFIYR